MEADLGYRMVVTAAGKHLSIGTERYAMNLPFMPGEPGDHVMGRCIVAPNTDGSRDSKLGAVRGMLNLSYTAFAEPRKCAFGQMRLRVFLSEGVW